MASKEQDISSSATEKSARTTSMKLGSSRNMYAQSWSAPHILRLNICIASLVLLASANGYDGSLINCLQAIPEWQNFADHPTGVWLGFIAAVYWIGMLLAFTTTATISNRFGRKPGLYFGLVLVALGAALQAAAVNTAMFVVARAVLGGAAGYWGSTAPVLISEIAFPSHREVATACYQCVGGTLAAWISFGTLRMDTNWSWRVPSLMQLLIPLIAAPGVFFAPESPRWLVSSNRHQEARYVIAHWHAGGDATSELVEHEMAEIQGALATERAATSASYLDMVKTAGNRRRLFITLSLGWFAQWCGNGVASYYLTSILNSVGVTSADTQLVITACLQVWNLICAMLAASLVKRLGKRVLFLSSASIMLVSYTLITALSATFAKTGNNAAGLAVVAFIFVFSFGYAIALTPLLVAYPCELWSFNLRSRGLTVTWTFTVLSAIFNILVNPIALEEIAWKYYFVFLVFAVAYGVTVYFVYPETSGLSLEEVGQLMDDPNLSARKTRRSQSKLSASEL